MDNGHITLRDYQLDMLSRVREAWKNHQSVMMQMPTGTGKTHVLAAVIKDFLQETKTEVWIIAHRRELVAQIEETVARYGICKEDGLVRAFSIQWLARHWDDVDSAPSLIVIDEAHHALAETYKELWTRYPEAKKLGMTATPCRMSHRGFTYLFDVLLTSWSIADFIREGRLSLFDYVSIRPDSEEQRLIDSLEKRGADGDYQLKEMANVLNRRPSIERLYRSVEKFAHNKKGIVYAISIDHARSIATYYNNKGIGAVAIDSRTPAAERKCLVEDFKAGKVRVLVNVDVFSEGFDCPDVEFVQMARPTLSLAKYLQQVGRGLRITKCKKACVLIDNVGLYRVFGLPTVAWDWETMFRGEASGKGIRPVCRPCDTALAIMRTEQETRDEEMEVVVSHVRLSDMLAGQEEVPSIHSKGLPELKAWQDGQTGLWGLRQGRKKTTGAVFITVFDIRYGMAAVRFKDKLCGLVNSAGETVWRKEHVQSMKFLRNHLLEATTSDRKTYYLDLHSLRAYDCKPEVRKFGNIELLKVGRTHYSRTRKVYVNNQQLNGDFITRYKSYLTVFDCKAPLSNSGKEYRTTGYQCGYACILEEDYDSYYWLYKRLPDGSVIVRDTAGQYYHVEDGKGKRYIGTDRPGSDGESFLEEMERLSERAGKRCLALQEEKEKERRRLMEKGDSATPFKSGLKWGLKVGNRITVPPIYRNIRPPVGRYCAVEKDYSQWGVIAIDGTVLVEPRYPEVSIGRNGTALLTSVTGKTISVKL